MKWTKEPPSVPGLYYFGTKDAIGSWWNVFGHGEVKITRNGPVLDTPWFHPEKRPSIESTYNPTHWSGPIPEPEE